MTIEQMTALANAGFTKEEILKFSGAETHPAGPAAETPPAGPTEEPTAKDPWAAVIQELADLKQTVQASNRLGAGFNSPPMQTVDDILAEMIAPPGAEGGKAT